MINRIEEILQNRVDMYLGTVTITAEFLREVLKSLKGHEATLGKARELLTKMIHDEDCARYRHDPCGVTKLPGNTWACCGGLSQEQCEAVKCNCGLDELKFTLNPGAQK